MSITIGNMQGYSPIPRTFTVQNKSSVFSEIIAPSGSTVVLCVRLMQRLY